MSSRSPNCHPGLVPGPSELAPGPNKKRPRSQPHPPNPVIPDSFRDLPGLPRELVKRPQSQAQPPLVAFKIPDMSCAIPGRPPNPVIPDLFRDLRDDPLTVIPDSFRDLPGSPRDLTKRPRCKNNPKQQTPNKTWHHLCSIFQNNNLPYTVSE